MVSKYVAFEELVYFAEVICYHFEKVLIVHKLHI